MRRFVGVAGKPTADAKAIAVIPGACYGLLLLAWVIDLVTPQSFVVSILLNGPIALSTLALQSRLTIRLIILAEVANVVAGYANGIAAGSHWDAIALGNRAISAATFVLVGTLTIRAQQSARSAGESDERVRQIERERRLRASMERVRASLNIELVLRAAVRELVDLTGAGRVLLGLRESALDVPWTYRMRAGDPDVVVAREQLPAELASFVEKSRASRSVVVVDPTHPIGGLVGEHAFVLDFAVDEVRAILSIGWGERRPASEDRDLVAAFADNLAVALQQARMFVRLGEQNVEIARTNERLAARGDVIRDIVYALAHDLRTPLAAADVTMKQATEGAYGQLPERYREILNVAMISNSELQRMVETLLLVARYEADDDSRMRTLERAKVAVDRVVAELRAMADAGSITLATTAGDDEITVEVDAAELRRALVNLTANAIAATPSGGSVTISVHRRRACARFEVVDDGFGVPLDRQKDLFSRFGGTRAGTGLGLYIVRRIAEKYGGVAGFEPRKPHGSVFFIELPEAVPAL